MGTSSAEDSKRVKGKVTQLAVNRSYLRPDLPLQLRTAAVTLAVQHRECNGKQIIYSGSVRHSHRWACHIRLQALCTTLGWVLRTLGLEDSQMASWSR